MKINEIFYSLQGEGLRMGVPTVFVRFAGCNLACKWCDTDYARTEDGAKIMNVDDVIKAVEKYKTRHVCITGGEPMMQRDSTKLINRLLDTGYHVCIETNGSKPLEDLGCTEDLLVSMDIKCPSSGMHSMMDFDNIELLGPTDQMKFIIQDQEDYDYAKETMKKYPHTCNVIMTPVGGIELKWLAERALKDKLDVRVMPQLHKLIWGEERGV